MPRPWLCLLWDDAPRHLAVSDHPDPPSLSAEGQAPELAEVVAGHHQQAAVHLLVVQLEADRGATAISVEWVFGVSEATVRRPRALLPQSSLFPKSLVVSTLVHYGPPHLIPSLH